MKKAKIMLTAIAVFAVIGGAMAFKAKRELGRIYCPTIAGGAFTSTVPYTRVANANPSTKPCALTTVYATTPSGPTFTGTVYLTIQ